MSVSHFHPIIQEWFQAKFGAPTDVQVAAWPQIAKGEHTLATAPTGSGKTLAAFLVAIDQLWKTWLETGQLEDQIEVIYISPLKALSNDIRRNLQTPLEEINQLAAEQGYDPAPIRAEVRTGDTPSSVRQKMLKKPPQILVTTPEIALLNAYLCKSA